MLYWPRILVPSLSTVPSTSLSSDRTAGITRELGGIMRDDAGYVFGEDTPGPVVYFENNKRRKERSLSSHPDGIPATFENRKMAAGRLPKKVRAPAKKKFPTDPPVKSNAAFDRECRIPL